MGIHRLSRHLISVVLLYNDISLINFMNMDHKMEKDSSIESPRTTKPLRVSYVPSDTSPRHAETRKGADSEKESSVGTQLLVEIATDDDRKFGRKFDSVEIEAIDKTLVAVVSGTPACDVYHSSGAN